MKKEEIINLLNKYRSNSCTPQEVEELLRYIQNGKDKEQVEKWIAEGFDDSYHYNLSEIPEVKESLKKVYQQVRQGLFEEEEFTKTETLDIVPLGDEVGKRSLNLHRLYRIAAVAAIFLIVLSIGLYINYDSLNTVNEVIAYENDIAPGGNHATLTLGDGQSIKLSDEHYGIIIDSDSIKYSDGSPISSPMISTEAESNEVLMNANKKQMLLNNTVRLPNSTPEKQLTLSTPKGGQYQIILSDDTKVWLNAASTLKYPSRFDRKERRVELEGEAYFEVAKNTKHPFIVESNGQEVAVLGTHFNVNAYPEDKEIKTTLIEGSVQVTSLSFPLVISNEADRSVRAKGTRTILFPGQQSVVNGSSIKVADIDTESIIAWKDGQFIFRNTDLSTILKELERWYDIEVDYNTIPKIKLYGEIPKNVNLSKLLEMIKDVSNVHYKIEGRRLILEK